MIVIILYCNVSDELNAVFISQYNLLRTNELHYAY